MSTRLPNTMVTPEPVPARRASRAAGAAGAEYADVHARRAGRVRALWRARHVSGAYLTGATRSGRALALSLDPLTAPTLMAIVAEARSAGLSLPVDIYAPGAIVADNIAWRTHPLPRPRHKP